MRFDHLTALVCACLTPSALADDTDRTRPGLTSHKPDRPRPTIRPKLPPVHSKVLQLQIRKENLARKARELEAAAYSTPDRNRVFASPGHANTLDFITKYLDRHKDYFTYERQPFTALYSQSSGNLSVNGVDQAGAPFEYAPSGKVTAPLVAVNNLGCSATDFPAEVKGSIALISRGTCEFGLKSALAGTAGAVGAILYDNINGTTFSGTLGAPPRPQGSYVPTVGVTKTRGLALRDNLAAGQALTGTLQVQSVIENRTTYNIIAETIGGDKSNVLVVGGHSDSVFAGPGINDDGSGIIGILEVAEQLTRWSTKNAVRFGFWSAEEFGLLGSKYYVKTLNETERAKIRLYLNFDMIASPNYILGVYDGDGSAFNISGPPGSAQAEHFFERFFADNKLNSTPTAFTGRSDYGPFLDVGIPAGGLFTGAEVLKTPQEAAMFGGQAGVAYDVNYHKVGDNYTNLNFDAFLWNTKAIAASVAEYGSSFAKLPQNNQTVARSFAAETFEPHFVGAGCHGHDHDHDHATM